MKKGLPHINFKIVETPEKAHLLIHRDLIGNVMFSLWKPGIGFTPLGGNISVNQLKKLRSWIDKMINYLERP